MVLETCSIGLIIRRVTSSISKVLIVWWTPSSSFSLALEVPLKSINEGGSDLSFVKSIRSRRNGSSSSSSGFLSKLGKWLSSIVLGSALCESPCNSFGGH